MEFLSTSVQTLSHYVPKKNGVLLETPTQLVNVNFKSKSTNSGLHVLLR